MSALLIAASLSYVLHRVEKTELPIITMHGEVVRVAAFEVSGDAAILSAFHTRIEAEGWNVKLLDDGTVVVIPNGHSLGEATALNFRIDNGEFGDLDTKVVFFPDRKRKR